MPRVRRPLLALIALVLVLVIGYTVRAVREEHSTPQRSHTPQPSVTATR